MSMFFLWDVVGNLKSNESRGDPFFTRMEHEKVRQWFQARDILFGQNYASRSFAKCLKLASQCDHEEARWLCRIVSCRNDIQDLLKQPDDPRAVAFGVLLSDKKDWSLIRQAAVGGSCLAEGLLAGHCDVGTERIMWAERAAAGGDPRGVHLLAHAMEQVDCERVVLLHKQAAELGWVHAQFDFGLTGFSEDSPERYVWWIKACLGSDDFLEDLLDGALAQLGRFDQHGGGKVVFAIGEGIKNEVCLSSRTVFKIAVSKARFTAAVRCVGLYEGWCDQARAAIVVWTLYAKRSIHVINADVRRLIGKMVWNNRDAWSAKKN